jgi:apolipoprotein N-acyltransferase
VLTWTGAEVLRAHVLTGFPWASPAQVTIDGALAPLLSFGGPHAATLVLMFLACVATAPLAPGKSVPGALLRVGLLLASVLALSLAPSRPPAPLSDHVVRLIQPNAAQHLKWQPDMARIFFERQLSLTAAPATSADARPALVVWSETAITWELDAAGQALDLMSEAAGDVPLAFGALRFEGRDLRNSLAVLAPQGGISELYDKHHLVPFGEYIPFGDLADRLGLEALAATMGGFSAGPGPRLLDFGPLGRALPLICYEAVFAQGVNRMPERADFLLQITNDAWFGAHAGPQQHLAQARMRAIEQGLPLVRAANTGISAMIDPLGRVIAELPLGQAGFIDAPLPLPLAPTLYSRAGDMPVIALLLCGLILFPALTLVRRNAHSD